MTEGRKVVFDTNFFALLSRIDSECELVELISNAYHGEGVADHSQLAKMDYCLRLRMSLSHHNITDEETALFLLNYKGKHNLQRIHGDDPTDLKLIVFTVQHNAVFLTCDRKLLQLSDELNLEHWCFKAAVHKLDGDVGGVFNDVSFQKIHNMFDKLGKHPFFHYAESRRCPQCDPKNRCKTKSNPPRFCDFNG